MGAPGASVDAPLMMRRQAARLSHKAERGLLCHPGKPLWGVWLKREETVLGTDHDVASFWPVLDARQDMNWLAGRFGCGTRAGCRGGELGWTLGRAGLLSRSQQAGGLMKLLLEQ